MDWLFVRHLRGTMKTRFFLLSMLTASLTYPMDPPMRGAKENSDRGIFNTTPSSNSDNVSRFLQTAADGTTQKEDRNTSLYWAVLRGKLAVRELLASGANVSARGPLGRTPLHVAVCVGCNTVELMEELLAKGASVDLQDDHGETPLHLARFSRVEVTRLLLESGAAVDARDNYGHTPLYKAASYGKSIEVVKELLGRGADVNGRANDGCTPLHGGAQFHNVEVIDVVRELLVKGALINAGNLKGETPLHVASGSSSGGVEIVRELLVRGAAVDPRDKAGDTPLHSAVLNRKSVEVVKELLERGADVNAQNNGGETPLHKAASSSNIHVEVIRELIRRGAQINAADKKGYTPLHWAVLVGKAEIVRELLDRGADLTVRNEHGKVPLENVPAERREMIAKIFAEHASKKEVECPICLELCKPSEQVTALPCGHVYHTGCVNNVLKSGKSCPTCRAMPVALDARTFDERLLLSATRGDLATVRLMLTQGADINAQNEAGHGVLFVVAVAGHAAIAESLLTHAGINRIQGLNQSLIAAAERNHKEVVRILLHHGALFDKNDPRMSILSDSLEGNGLLLAAVVSDVDRVGSELARQANVSIIQEALLLAIAQGNVAVVERLIGYFVDNGRAEYLAKEALERLRIVCARSQNDALTERYRKIERLLVAGSPIVLGIMSIPSTALPVFLVP